MLDMPLLFTVIFTIVDSSIFAGANVVSGRFVQRGKIIKRESRRDPVGWTFFAGSVIIIPSVLGIKDQHLG